MKIIKDKLCISIISEKKKLWEIKRKFMQLHNLFLLIKFDAQLYFPYFIINIVQKKVCLFFLRSISYDKIS